MSNDIDDWNDLEDLERLIKKTKGKEKIRLQKLYKKEFKKFHNKYIEIKGK